MTRKEFLGSLMGMAALAACGGDDGGSTADAAPAGRNCAVNGTNAEIGNNHGHVLAVPKTDVTAGVEKTYDITGTSAHAHSVTVTSANFATLQSNANGTVMVTSTSGGGHTHSIMITCA